MPGNISLVPIRCRCTRLIPDFYPAEGRNFVTGSKPTTRSSSFLQDYISFTDQRKHKGQLTFLGCGGYPPHPQFFLKIILFWLMLDSGVLYRNIRHNHLKLFNYSLRRIKTAIMDNSLKIQYVMVNQRDKTLKHNMSHYFNHTSTKLIRGKSRQKRCHFSLNVL